MTQAGQPAAVELALCGSNLTGDVPFSCALRCRGAVTAAQSPAVGRGDLASLVARLCTEAGLQPAAVNGIRIDVGPGSYTGLRVAVTFVRFLQRFGAVQVQALDSLALLVARARPDVGTPVQALLDARRGRMHTQRFLRAADGAWHATGPAQAIPLANVLADTRSGDLVVMPAALAAQLGGEFLARGASVQAEAALTASELFAEGLPFFAAGTAELEPRYLMGSYVED
jgi:tRNA threonylcarbamoyladenosine biosynthesis protein TsaB